MRQQQEAVDCLAIALVRSAPIRASASRAKESLASETAECFYVADAIARVMTPPGRQSARDHACNTRYDSMYDDA
jgi:hypothetical protein